VNLIESLKTDIISLVGKYYDKLYGAHFKNMGTSQKGSKKINNE